VLRFRLMVKRGPCERPQASEGEPAAENEEWRDKESGELMKSCTMVITEPNKFVAEVHADSVEVLRSITNAAATKLLALLNTGITEISYLYDMGDSWQHRIIVEKLKAAEPGVLYPQFLGGERRCPPEDCGGMPGYYEFLDGIASKQNKKRKVALDWYGGPYDPR
jgi:hypothetical protein